MKPAFLLRLASLVAVLPLLASCAGAPFWLLGDWTFDSERAQRDLAALTAPASTPSSNPPAPDPTQGMSIMLVNMVLPQLKGMELVVTGKELIITVQGQGKSLPYQTIKKSSTEFVLKEPDGTVTTYYRDGDEIYSFGTGGLSTFRFYMKRKN